ncbi:hypothetical protein KAI78_05855 [bacterium]|nr:hypothetical protein [bacterium]
MNKLLISLILVLFSISICCKDVIIVDIEGQAIAGNLIELVPGEKVIIEKDDGEILELKYDQIKDLTSRSAEFGDSGEKNNFNTTVMKIGLATKLEDYTLCRLGLELNFRKFNWGNLFFDFRLDYADSISSINISQGIRVLPASSNSGMYIVSMVGALFGFGAYNEDIIFPNFMLGIGFFCRDSVGNVLFLELGLESYKYITREWDPWWGSVSYSNTTVILILNLGLGF